MNPVQTFDALLQNGIERIVNREFEAALSIAREIQSLDPESADGYHLAAIALQHAFKWDESLTELDKALLNAPYDAGLYSLRGFAKMSLNDYSGAESDFLEAISLEDFEAAHRNLVLLRILQNRSKEAVDLLTERIRKHPENIDNLTMMGDLMTKIGQPDRAESWYAAAADASGKN